MNEKIKDINFRNNVILKFLKIATENKQIVKHPYPITIVFFWPKRLVGTNEKQLAIKLIKLIT